MSLIALTGDYTTTTSLALAGAWPREDPVLVLEADPRGGSLAAWLDVPLSPSLSTLVAAVHRISDEDEAGTVDIGSLIRSTSTGVDYVPAPFRSREAARAVAESRRVLLPRLRSERVVIADLGRVFPGADPTEQIGTPDVTVVCHRQEAASPGAASARLERLAEQLEVVTTRSPDVIVAVIGTEPFDCAQIAEHVDPELTWVELATDPLTAAVHAGRTGVSERRLRRLPLSRTARDLADVIRSMAPAVTPHDAPRPISLAEPA